VRTQSSTEGSITEKPQLNQVFGKWVQDRILLVWIFILSFVVLDSFFTYVGVNHYGISERNYFVTTILSLGNGWLIWLVLKVMIAVLGTALFFLTYYYVSTSKMTRKDRDGVLLFEFCGWVYIVSLNLFSVFIWSGTFIARLS